MMLALEEQHALIKDQRREGVVILLENADGQIAFQLRDDKPEIMYPNYWGLFGGWAEAGESPQQTVVREIREELGYSLDASKLVYLKMHNDGEVRTHILHYPVALVHESGDKRELSPVAY